MDTHTHSAAVTLVKATASSRVATQRVSNYIKVKQQMVHQAHSKPMCMHVTMHIASYDVCILKFRTGSSSQREIKSI